MAIAFAAYATFESRYDPNYAAGNICKGHGGPIAFRQVRVHTDE
jgi:hypothetical protein